MRRKEEDLRIGGSDELEVGGALGVGDDPPGVEAMVGLVLYALLTGEERLGGGEGIGAGEETQLGGGGGVEGDQDEPRRRGMRGMRKMRMW